MNKRLTICLLLAPLLSPVFAAETQVSRNAETGLTTWKVRERGISVEFIQLTPEAAQATYDSRDLPPAIYDSLRSYCMFGSVVRNEAKGPLRYRVAEWRHVGADGVRQRLRTKSQWVEDWKNKGANFAWSILPDDITLETGDWSLGYTPVKVRAGEQFDLIFVWSQHGKKHTGILRGLVCAGPQAAS